MTAWRTPQNKLFLFLNSMIHETPSLMRLEVCVFLAARCQLIRWISRSGKKRNERERYVCTSRCTSSTIQGRSTSFAKTKWGVTCLSFQGWSKDVPWTSFQAPQEFHNWAKGAWCPELPVWQAGKAWLRTWADLWSSPEQVSQQPSTCQNPQTGPCRIRPYLSCKYIKYNCRRRLPKKGVTWFC